MISEPEMDGEDGTEHPGPLPAGAALPGAGQDVGLDVLGGEDRPPSPLVRLGARSRAWARGAKDRPWVWALGATVVTSAVWAGTLVGAGYGRTAAPDLHGYHVTDDPCTHVNLQPLADDLDAGTFTQDPPTVASSAALDHVDCALVASSTAGDGWTADYTLAVTVDLHKKTDPSAEFDSTGQAEGQHPHIPGVAFVVVDIPERISHPGGLGDRANLTTSQFRQSLAVRHGGAVFTLTVTGTNEWNPGFGAKPVAPDGTGARPAVIDTSALTKDLAPTMRHLMAALAQPQP